MSRRVPPLGAGWGLVSPTGSRLRWTACSAPRLFSVAGTVTSHHAPRTLAIKWPHSTRLETRTKESNMCASLRVKEARGRNESEGGLVSLRREPVPRGGCIVDRPILLSGRFEWERTCWDPKDGELCLNRVKPGKLWWRLVAILTCKSIVKFEYRGERLIEPSSSWFPPKFPLRIAGTY